MTARLTWAGYIRIRRRGHHRFPRSRFGLRLPYLNSQRNPTASCANLPLCDEFSTGAAWCAVNLRWAGHRGRPAAGANGSFGLRLTLPISAPGLTVKAYFDFLGFVRGPEEVTLQSIGVGQPFPAATQEHLFGVLVGRASSHPLP